MFLIKRSVARVGCRQGSKEMPKFSDIFEWNGWEEWCETKAFYACVLLRDVGEFNVGYKFASISWNDEEFTLTFYDNLEDVDPIMVKKMRLVEID